MAKNGIGVRTTDTILGELDRLNHAISERAYSLFRDSGGIGSAVSDWLNAEHELVWKPAIELRRKNGQYELLAATAGVAAADLDVEVTQDDVLIKAKVGHSHEAEKGNVQLCEFERGQLFRSIHFPERIDPGQVKADYKDGLLRITAPVATKTSTKIDIKTL
ncbi:MAG TPA: Hsp20/alpha crystallin family protein [Vicinamibacterales bacterium]|nr:Hsp20/alpha crystallin family protein [Vicinamibacterales bacterium]